MSPLFRSATRPRAPHERSPRRLRRAALLAVLGTTLLAACGSDDDDDGIDGGIGGGSADGVDGTTDGDGANGGTSGGTDGDTEGDGSGAPPADAGERYAFVSGATPTFDAGQVERFTLDGEIVASGTIASETSDVEVATDGTDLYRIGKFMNDTLTRYAEGDPDALVWQYSVNGDEPGIDSANPYDIVFASETKAYVIRYGSPLIWIVDPTATELGAFKTGEIDLSAYDVDEAPQASAAVLVDGRLFVLLQRLESVGDSFFLPVKESYVAVIDTETDTEIATGMGADGLDGIRLEVRNGVDIFHDEDADELYVVARGNFFESPAVPGDPYTGGIETVDPDTYEHELLLDDGSADDNAGFVLDALVLSPDKGYVLTLAGYAEDFSAITTLRSFSPITGTIVDEVVAGFDGRDIGVLAEDLDGRVWVGYNDSAEPGFTLLDPADDSVLVERVPTLFNPNDVVFTEVSAASPPQ